MAILTSIHDLLCLPLILWKEHIHASIFLASIFFRPPNVSISLQSLPRTLYITSRAIPILLLISVFFTVSLLVGCAVARSFDVSVFVTQSCNYN